ncbi:hypothetical protein HDU85_006576 [Gaertneriomyces sp. JEL0708]|nr:hypothetical protein HDU85_006576 [Gaertneriomyces sp. JEL0708]
MDWERSGATPLDYTNAPFLRNLQQLTESTERKQKGRRSSSSSPEEGIFTFTKSPFSPSTPSKELRKLAPLPSKRHQRSQSRDVTLATESASDEDIPVRGNDRKRKKRDEPESPFRSSSRNERTDGFSPKLVLLPYMVSGYLQMMFSTFIIGVMFYMVVQFIMTVRHDLEMKAEEYSMEIIQQVAECSKLYIDNKCDPSTRVQYMEKTCQEWEMCMQKDPREVGRLKVGAETLAEILNKLVEPLSYKTMAFGTILLFGTLVLTSTAFNIVKSRTSAANSNVPSYHHHPPPPTFVYMPPPSPGIAHDPWNGFTVPPIRGSPYNESPSKSSRKQLVRRPRPSTTDDSDDE